MRFIFLSTFLCIPTFYGIVGMFITLGTFLALVLVSISTNLSYTHACNEQ